ncbi:hypothetical protein OQA88_5126 [Cercophora sp. LCS_1]
MGSVIPIQDGTAKDAAMSQSNGNLHSTLIAKMKGQVMHVPDLLALFPGWPSGGRNRHYDRLKAKLDEVIITVHPDEKSRERARKHDFAFMTSCWFPIAEWEEFYTVGISRFWLFHFDDAMDDNDGVVAGDLSASQRYRNQALKYICWSLGLENTGFGKMTEASAGFPAAPNLPNTTFKEFGDRMRGQTSIAFCGMLYTELRKYIDYCGREQGERLAGQISKNVETYLGMRLYTGGVRPYGWITQLALGIRIPIWVIETTEMHQLLDELTYVIVLINASQ